MANLIINPSIEPDIGLSGYSVPGGWEVDPTGQVGYCATCSIFNGTTSWLRSQSVSVTAGITYTLSFLLRIGITTSGSNFIIEQSNVNGSVVSNTSNSLDGAASTWITITQAIVPLDGVNSISILFGILNGSGTFSIDQVSLG